MAEKQRENDCEKIQLHEKVPVPIICSGEINNKFEMNY